MVFDGPLRGRNHPAGVGYVKTQQVQYLPEPLVPVLGQLGDGDRTPVMLIGGRGFTRYSWYLRLPGPRNQPLSHCPTRTRDSAQERTQCPRR